MTFKTKYDWMYRRMKANLPVTGYEYLRPEFDKWWEQLCILNDGDFKI